MHILLRGLERGDQPERERGRRGQPERKPQHGQIRMGIDSQLREWFPASGREQPREQSLERPPRQQRPATPPASAMIVLSVSSCWISRAAWSRRPTGARRFPGVDSRPAPAAGWRRWRRRSAAPVQRLRERSPPQLRSSRRATGSDSDVAGATINAVVRPGCC